MKSHIAFLIAGILAMGTSTASAQSAGARANADASVSDRPIVHAGVFLINADGRRGGSAVQTGDKVGADLGGSVYVAPCASVGAADRGLPVSGLASDVWQLSGNVLEISDEQAIVQIGWQRLRRGGHDETSPKQSTTLTLKRGDRSTLESLSIPTAGWCEGRTVSLDVVFASLGELYKPAPSTNGGGSGPQGWKTYKLQRDARTGRTSVAVGKSDPSASEALYAELWLVRSTPGRPDDTLHVKAPLGSLPRPFAFDPVIVQSAAGPLTIKVEGTVEVGQSAEGEPRFHFSASRTHAFATAARPSRDLQPIIEGSTKTTVALPGPDEVLSFELPPIKTRDGVALPDKLSIRVRLIFYPAPEQ